MILLIIMFILMMGSMISGILLSSHIFKWIKISGTYMVARQIHMFCAYWGLVVLDVKGTDYFEGTPVTYQHGGGYLFYRDKEIMGWLFNH